MSTEILQEPNGEHGRYVIVVDGNEAGELEYRQMEGSRALTHTGVAEEHEGGGLAGALTRRALDDARRDGLRVIPLCPFVAGYIERHPGDAGLVDQAAWDNIRAE
ncbi:GNAT family N-acetyltransferase [soil metagenome]